MQHSLRKGLLAVFTSNIIAILAGVAISFVIPKIMGSVSEYGYWQLYFFYTGYYGLFLFGLNDGMNLLFAGKKLNESDRRTISTIFIYLLGILLTGGIIAFMFGVQIVHDPLNLTLYIAVLVNIGILNVTGYTIHVNQILLRFKTYARINVLERVLFATLLVPLWLVDAKTYIIFVCINTIVRLIVMVYGLLSIRDVWLFGENYLSNAFLGRRKIFKYMLVGFPITIGTIFSMLIMTSPRIVIEKTHSIHDYGLFSLAFSILSIVILTISAISAVLYPTLKSIEAARHASIFSKLNYGITILCGISLLGCFLVPTVLKLYLPAYSDIGIYIFPLMSWVIYQCLGSIINDAFLRVSRMEWMLLKVNVSAFIIISVIEYLTIIQTKSITVMILAGLLGLMGWVHFTRWLIYRKNGWKQHIIDYIDIPIVTVFLLISNYNGGVFGFTLYAAFLIGILFIFRRYNTKLLIGLRDPSVREQPGS